MYDFISNPSRSQRRLPAEDGPGALTPKRVIGAPGNAKGMTATGPTAQEMVNRLRDGHPGTEELVHRIFRECIRSIEPAGELGTAATTCCCTRRDRRWVVRRPSPPCAGPPRFPRGW